MKKRYYLEVVAERRRRHFGNKVERYANDKVGELRKAEPVTSWFW
jgi:hypothetical protein